MTQLTTVQALTRLDAPLAFCRSESGSTNLHRFRTEGGRVRWNCVNRR